jgi:hypothetical protein
MKHDSNAEQEWEVFFCWNQWDVMYDRCAPNARRPCICRSETLDCIPCIAIVYNLVTLHEDSNVIEFEHSTV